MRKTYVKIITAAVAVAAVAALAATASAADDEIINLYDKSAAFGGYISADGTENVYSGHFTSEYIEVTPGEKIYFGPCNPGQDYQLHGYNENKKCIAANVGTNKLDTVDTFSNGFVIMSYTVPSNVKYIRTANPADYNDVYLICREELDTEKFENFWGEDKLKELSLSTAKIEKYESKMFTGKRALFVGDSICYASPERGTAACGWAGRIQMATGMVCNNLSVSGTSISDCRSSTYGRIVSQILSTKPGSYDYVILQGGVNDAWDKAAVGNITDSRDRSDFDKSTYTGGLEDLFSYTTERFPNAKIGYIFTFSTPKYNTGNITKMQPYYDMAKQICAKWGIPFLNMYEDESFNKDVLKTSKITNLRDMLHPNSAGYDILYRYIMLWMEKIPSHDEIVASPKSFNLEAFPVKETYNPRTGSALWPIAAAALISGAAALALWPRKKRG